MKLLVKLSLLASALTLLGAPASAQMTMSKGAGHQAAGKTQAMMTDCSAMMQEVMADPVVRKRMMAIMQKHMQQHAGGSGMMSGMSGGSAMQGGKASSGSASHEAHHTTVPLATPTSSSSPMAVPSP